MEATPHIAATEQPWHPRSYTTCLDGSKRFSGPCGGLSPRRQAPRAAFEPFPGHFHLVGFRDFARLHNQAPEHLPNTDGKNQRVSFGIMVGN